MKIQSLAVLSIIIILPMAILLNSYSRNQIKTLDLQNTYDSKLQDATYDAIKAFQLNMSNSSTSDLANSKMRDIEASINTFYNSLGSNFEMAGYGEDVLQNYVPAIVYTLYDGYYIYSAYDNATKKSDFDQNTTSTSYAEAEEQIYGLKPYVYYSCRYKKAGNFDIVITYTLDNYITVQGTIGSENVNESGYLLSGAKNEGGTISYNGVTINNESTLRQKVYVPLENGETDVSGGEDKQAISIEDGSNIYTTGYTVTYPYKKVNGVKYYRQDNGNVFAMINDEKRNQEDVKVTNSDNNAKKFYEESAAFTERITSLLGELKSNDAVDSNGEPLGDKITQNLNIFKTSGGVNFEDSNSDFNTHKIEVIRNSIETNLMVAIEQYNKVSTSDVSFAMPKLKDYEWEDLTQNVSMITFLQGLSIGGKVYSGYSIVRNDITDDFVSEDSIYIKAGDSYYRVTDSKLLDTSSGITGEVGILNTDFERRTALARRRINGSGSEEGTTLEKNIYYYPREESASYSSIIDLNGRANDAIGKTTTEYVKDLASHTPGSREYQLAELYYTALGREKFGQYRVMNLYEDVQNDLQDAGY